MYLIHEYVKKIIELSTEIEKFDFQETKSDSTTTPKFNVTLGVMPDYLFDGKGMRIDVDFQRKNSRKVWYSKGI